MIPWAIKNWRLVASVLGPIIVFVALSAGAAYERGQGYSDGYSKAKQQCEDDKAKMETANTNAINKAASSLASAEQQIQLKEGQLDDAEKALDLAASQDPHASDCGIDSNATSRLDGIR